MQGNDIGNVENEIGTREIKMVMINFVPECI
jgi:hypothetical protein